VERKTGLSSARWPRWGTHNLNLVSPEALWHPNSPTMSASRTLGDYFWMTRDPTPITGQAVFEQGPAAGQFSAIKDPLTRSVYASGRFLSVWSLA
jgi:hypothetical protein